MSFILIKDMVTLLLRVKSSVTITTRMAAENGCGRGLAWTRPQAARGEFGIDEIQASAALSGGFSLRTFLLPESKESASNKLRIE